MKRVGDRLGSWLLELGLRRSLRLFPGEFQEGKVFDGTRPSELGVLKRWVTVRYASHQGDGQKQEGDMPQGGGDNCSPRNTAFYRGIAKGALSVFGR
jgi:hypothetical protein